MDLKQEQGISLHLDKALKSHNSECFKRREKCQIFIREQGNSCDGKRSECQLTGHGVTHRFALAPFFFDLC
jgi:hypothetical protein